MKITKDNTTIHELMGFAAKIQRKNYSIAGEKGVCKIEGNRLYITDSQVLLTIDFTDFFDFEPGMYRIVKQGTDFLLIPAPDINTEGVYNIYERIAEMTIGLDPGNNYIEFITGKDDTTYCHNIYNIMITGVCFNFATYLPKKVLLSFDGVYTGESAQPLMFVNNMAKYYVMPVKS